jgi:hypothetical protein
VIVFYLLSGIDNTPRVTARLGRISSSAISRAAPSFIDGNGSMVLTKDERETPRMERSPSPAI